MGFSIYIKFAMACVVAYAFYWTFDAGCDSCAAKANVVWEKKYNEDLKIKNAEIVRLTKANQATRKEGNAKVLAVATRYAKYAEGYKNEAKGAKKRIADLAAAHQLLLTTKARGGDLDSGDGGKRVITGASQSDDQRDKIITRSERDSIREILWRTGIHFSGVERDRNRIIEKAHSLQDQISIDRGLPVTD